MTCYYLDLVRAFSWFRLPRGKFASTNQKYHPDLGGESDWLKKKHLKSCCLPQQLPASAHAYFFRSCFINCDDDDHRYYCNNIIADELLLNFGAKFQR